MPNVRSILYACLAAGALAGGWLAPRAWSRPTGDEPVANAGASVRYGRDIRPLLSDRCFQCHGPDAAKRQADLRLDQAEDATKPRKKGERAIVPGNFESSEVWKRVNSTDPKIIMPPPDSGKRSLSESERALVAGWIANGAAYEPHWAFVAPTTPSKPTVRDPAWARSPIDQFIAARLEREDLRPSPEADRSTLLRRVFLDLTGLPPTPEELASFLADTSPDAYERQVDRLLTQEPYRSRFAERMATPWLDQARFADTCGIHMDAGRQIWPYRDYVLKAFRDNMPFDRFVVEQMAGDLLPDATTDQKVASGFNRNHVTTDEGGAIDEEYKVEYSVDRTATTGSVFLGLTLGCARCHDHKYDPVTTEDFYSLFAFFDSIEEPGLYSQTPDPNRAHEPFLEVPTPEQAARRDRLNGELAELRRALDRRTPEEDAQRTAFFGTLREQSGLAWPAVTLASATSLAGSTVTAGADGSVSVSGENPAKDELELVLRTQGVGLRLVSLEALPDPANQNRLGRAFNGNVVITGFTVEATSVADPNRHEPVGFTWIWADHSQSDGDYDATTLLRNDDERGWALAGHQKPGGRVALLLAERPFGFEGGTELRVRVRCGSKYAQHNVSRVRVSVGTINDAGLARLPATGGHWYATGPYPSQQDPQEMYNTVIGPEQATTIDFTHDFGHGGHFWTFEQGLVDDRPVALPEGRNVIFVGRTVWSPTARELPVSLGSDDGFMLFVNGAMVAEHRIDRGVMPDQDKAVLPLRAGANTVVMKIVNTGGPAGYYYRAVPADETLAGELAAAVLPEQLRSGELAGRIELAWRTRFFPVYRETFAKLKGTEASLQALVAAMPRTMVMKEMPTPRETFVLRRGQYDQPDKARPVHRRVPASLGSLPEGAPANRLGLARWLVAPENPLLARVTVNRYWELCFGTGIVRTTEDFGLQGEWPSHPELLDWLATDFRDHGWDVKRTIRQIVTSRTYRQSSSARPELREHDPENRLLASFPRRRLSAEQLRDQALYVSGLLVERLGGPSVKPYQPDGLWQEVAMPQSNTRAYERGMGEDLYRRSLYTYWKRACPPPSMLTFDAPTRESCTIRRPNTSTPLQALTLWNDVQFVEASRVLAQRTLESAGGDAERLRGLFLRVVTREPRGEEMAVLSRTLAEFRTRYRAVPGDAVGLVTQGDAPIDAEGDPVELAAWTMVAQVTMNLYETTTQH